MVSYSSVSDVFALMQHVVEYCDAPLRDVNQRGIFGNTPLKVAAIWGDIDAACLLIDAGADVNAKNGDGYTALHWAAESDDRGMARLLIERGASLRQKNDEGLTPLDLALSSGHDAVAEFLRSAE